MFALYFCVCFVFLCLLCIFVFALYFCICFVFLYFPSFILFHSFCCTCTASYFQFVASSVVGFDNLLRGRVSFVTNESVLLAFRNHHSSSRADASFESFEWFVSFVRLHVGLVRVVCMFEM